MERRVDAHLTATLRQYERVGEGLPKRIGTGYESWVHCCQPETKRAKIPYAGICGKSYADAIGDHQAPLAAEQYTSKETTVTSASCTSSNFLRNYLRPVVGSEHRGLFSTGVLLLHDSFRPHTALVAAETIRHIRVSSSSTVLA
jgi:hypothetical protein